MNTAPRHLGENYKGFQTFQEDLARANVTEVELSEHMAKTFDLEILKYNDNYKYDTLFRTASGKEFTVEIKEDFTCARTGNVGLEYSCRGKDSGISISEANMYLYKVHRPGNKYLRLLITTNDLKQLIADNKYFMTVNGGDPGSNSLNYLFKLDVIQAAAKVI